MTFIEKFPRGIRLIASTVRLWLNVLACAAMTTLLLTGLQRAGPALPWPPEPVAQTVSLAPDRTAMLHVTGHTPMPRVDFETTFAGAAASLRLGRFAEAYGRFIALADEGDADAGCIALVMHRYGPEVFGSMWDATAEQLAQWSRMCEATARKELASRLGKP